MIKITVLTYKKKTGKSSFTEWLDDLDIQIRAKVRARIDRVSIGNFGDCKQLKNASGIWELRINYGSGYRVYFGKKGNKEVKSVILKKQSNVGKKLRNYYE